MANLKTRRIIKWLVRAGFVFLLLVMLASFAVYIAPRFGWRIDVLVSGSMAPELQAGDMVVTHAVNPETIAVGDIIAFFATDARENLVSHRVIGINSPLSFQTKGDANPAEDPAAIPPRNFVGRVTFHVPLLGYPVGLLKTSTGLILGLIVPGLAIMFVCVRGLRSEFRNKSDGVKFTASIPEREGGEDAHN